MNQLLRPPPIHNIGAINTVFIGVISARNLLVFEHFLGVGTCNPEFGHSINHIDRNAITINLVLNG
jgi:hypothetical protein